MANSISETFICSITHEIMKDPVIDNEGNSYDKDAIINWLQHNNTSPITRNYLHHSHLKPNRALADAIEVFKRNTTNTNNENTTLHNNQSQINFEDTIPSSPNHIHFGGGQTEARIDLMPGIYTLQLLLGNMSHVPHQPPVLSPKIKITVVN